MTLNDFLKLKGIGLSLPVFRSWINENLDELTGIVMVIKREKRTTYRVLDADQLVKKMGENK